MAGLNGQMVVVVNLVWRVDTFAFAAASPLGLRSPARLLVLVVVDDARSGSESGRRESRSVEERTQRHVDEIRVMERAESGLRL